MVTKYSQKSEPWANMTLGKSSLTMAGSGCFVCSLASLLDQSPDITLEALNKAGAIDSWGKLLSDKAAPALKMRYKGKAKNRPPDKDFPLICETDYYKNKGYPQHFFLYMGKQIMDPLNGEIYDNFYPIVSYRLFKVKPEAVYPARPPEADSAPTAPAEAKLKELAAEKAKASNSSNLPYLRALWERTWMGILDIWKKLLSNFIKTK